MDSSADKNKVQKINNLEVATNVTRNNKNNSINRRFDNCLMNIKDPLIRRWLFKSSSPYHYNEIDQLVEKHQQKKLVTPAKKRSSLARPVRVQDSCLQDSRPIVIDWNDDEDYEYQGILQLQQQQTPPLNYATDGEVIIITQ